MAHDDRTGQPGIAQCCAGRLHDLAPLTRMRYPRAAVAPTGLRSMIGNRINMTIAYHVHGLHARAATMAICCLRVINEYSESRFDTVRKSPLC